MKLFDDSLRAVKNSIITVGICPCWDITCQVAGIEWGGHKQITSQSSVPAGKAFNISKSLAWLGVENTAAGVWGKIDYQQLLESAGGINNIDMKFTVVSGQTRQNVTVVDTKANREMHLRAASELATADSLKQLKIDLDLIVDSNSTVVFAGAMPEEHLEDCVSIISMVRDKGAKVAVDTSGAALQRIVASGGIHIIKPNLEELCHLLGEAVSSDVSSIVKAARKLCDKVEIVVVSMGADGAVVVTQEAAFECKIGASEYKAVNTVGCGDYLLAGFIAGLENGNKSEALAKGVKAATARTWGLVEKIDWLQAEKKVKIEKRRVVYE